MEHTTDAETGKCPTATVTVTASVSFGVDRQAMEHTTDAKTGKCPAATNTGR